MKKSALILLFVFSLIGSSYALPPIYYSSPGTWVVPAGYVELSYNLYSEMEAGSFVSLIVNGATIDGVTPTGMSTAYGSIPISEGDIIEITVKDGGGAYSVNVWLSPPPQPPAPPGPQLPPNINHYGEGTWVVPAGYTKCDYDVGLYDYVPGHSVSLLKNGVLIDTTPSYDPSYSANSAYFSGSIPVVKGDVLTVVYTRLYSELGMSAHLALSGDGVINDPLEPIRMDSAGEWAVPYGYTKLYYYFYFPGTHRGNTVALYRNDELVSTLFSDGVDNGYINVSTGDKLKLMYWEFTPNNDPTIKMLLVDDTFVVEPEPEPEPEPDPEPSMPPLPLIEYNGPGTWVVPTGYTTLYYNLRVDMEVAACVDLIVNGRVIAGVAGSSPGVEYNSIPVSEGDIVTVMLGCGGGDHFIAVTLIPPPQPPAPQLPPNIDYYGEGTWVVPVGYTKCDYNIGVDDYVGGHFISFFKNGILIYETASSNTPYPTYGSGSEGSIPVARGDILAVTYTRLYGEISMSAHLTLSGDGSDPMPELEPIIMRGKGQWKVPPNVGYVDCYYSFSHYGLGATITFYLDNAIYAIVSGYPGKKGYIAIPGEPTGNSAHILTVMYAGNMYGPDATVIISGFNKAPLYHSRSPVLGYVTGIPDINPPPPLTPEQIRIQHLENVCRYTHLLKEASMQDKSKWYEPAFRVAANSRFVRGTEDRKHSDFSACTDELPPIYADRLYVKVMAKTTTKTYTAVREEKNANYADVSITKAGYGVGKICSVSSWHEADYRGVMLRDYQSNGSCPSSNDDDWVEIPIWPFPEWPPNWP